METITREEYNNIPIKDSDVVFKMSKQHFKVNETFLCKFSNDIHADNTVILMRCKMTIENDEPNINFIVEPRKLID